MRTYTIKDFDNEFPDDNACLDYLKGIRWPDGIYCPVCQKITTHYRITARKVYACEFCAAQVSPTAGTIFHKSPTPLRSWFHAMFLMTSTKTGISAKQLERELGVTYKTAWRIFTQIRKLMAYNPNPLNGIIEIDDTYIGGKHSGKRGRGAEGKTIVMGMAERDGQAVAQVVPDVKASTLLSVIETHAPDNKGTSIFTDEFNSYNKVEKSGYAHEVVQHAAKQYVRGIVHVNTVESLWSTIKRGIDGVNHSVSPEYLQSYLDSYIYRYNHRKDEQPMFLSLLERVAALPREQAVQPS